MALQHLFRHPGLSASQAAALLRRVQTSAASVISAIDSEFCFNVAAARALTAPEMDVLRWLLAETFEPAGFAERSLLPAGGQVLEVGPRMSFTTAWSTNAVAVCHVHDRMTECPTRAARELRDGRRRPGPRERGAGAARRAARRSSGSTGSWGSPSTTGTWTTTRPVPRPHGPQPTDVECFDIAQSNSEHSRHWFFKGRLVIDGARRPST
jgi:phosphoribosylformylglycinamidine synthase